MVILGPHDERMTRLRQISSRPDLHNHIVRREHYPNSTNPAYTATHAREDVSKVPKRSCRYVIPSKLADGLHK